MKSETPRTDAEKSRHNSNHWLAGDEVVSALFASELESELERERQIKERIYKDGLRFHRELMELKKRMAAMPNVES
jgi:hypothetical protein